MTEGTITDSDIRTVVDAFVSIANNTPGLAGVMQTYRSKRSLAVKLLDTSAMEGFIVEGGRIRNIHRLDNPTVVVTMGKNTFWHIINSPSAKVARLRVYSAIFSEETIHVDPPPGVEAGALHLENVLTLFGTIAETALK
jgi:hypothetical protein